MGSYNLYIGYFTEERTAFIGIRRPPLKSGDLVHKVAEELKRRGEQPRATRFKNENSIIRYTEEILLNLEKDGYKIDVSIGKKVSEEIRERLTFLVNEIIKRAEIAEKIKIKLEGLDPKIRRIHEEVIKRLGEETYYETYIEQKEEEYQPKNTEDPTFVDNIVDGLGKRLEEGG